MISAVDIQDLWTCPKCGRQFERRNQLHSCKSFALEEHFKNKPLGKSLYKTFRTSVKKQVGNFKVESLECCIHFVSRSTFAAVKIFKDKIQVDFSLSRKIKNKRLFKTFPLSAHRVLYLTDIYTETEIDKELMDWIQEAYDYKKEKTGKIGLNPLK